MDRRWLKVVLLVVCALSRAAANAQAIASEPSVEVLSPGASALVSPDAKLERWVTCCLWAEGPAFAPDGRLFVADTKRNQLLTVAPDGTIAVFKKPSGNTDPNFHGPETGSNGNAFDTEGRLYVAGHALRNVFRYDHLSGNSRLTELADRYDGKRFNSPNDVIIASDGSAYFTDPPYGLQTQKNSDPAKQLPFDGVFLLRGADRKPADSAPEVPVVVVRNLKEPNGIALSPDEKFLYISDSDVAHPVWMRYPRRSDGTVGPGTLLLTSKGAAGIGGPDGMKVDSKGNLYGAGPGGLWIISPSGVHLATIHVPEKVSNCAWGGPGKSVLYITASTSVYRIQTLTTGFDPAIHH